MRMVANMMNKLSIFNYKILVLLLLGIIGVFQQQQKIRNINNGRLHINNNNYK